LYETVRGLLIYAKEGKFDHLFAQERVAYHLGQVIQACFLDHAQKVMDLLATSVAGKEIRNDDKLFDLLNYAIGSLKCFTHSNRLVQEEAIQTRIISVLAAVIDKVIFTQAVQGQKKAMILV
jgi:DNA replication protein DnaD